LASFVLTYLSLPRLRRRFSRATWAGLISASVWQIANYLIPLATFPYLARTLGVSGFGVIGVGAAITSYALLLTDWGFALSGTQQAARERHNPAAINRIIWQTVAAKAILGLFSAGAMALGACVLVDSPALRAVLIMSTLNVLGAVFTVDWALRGVEALSQFATASIIGRLAVVPLVFLLVHESGDVAQATFAGAAGGLITAAVTLFMARGLGILARPSLSRGDVLLCLKGGTHIFLSTAIVSAYTNSLTVILSLVSGTQQVGILSGGEKIRRPVQSLLAPISMVFYPRMNFLAGSNPDKARDMSLSLLRVQGGLSFLLSAGLCVGAPMAVRILLGSGFEQAIVVLQILSWQIFVIGVSNVLGVMIMLPFGMKREFTTCIFAGAVVGIGLAVPLSFYAGAVGAATAAVCSEAAVALAMYGIVARRLDWRRSPWTVA
jgi:O-antigen/teichoic acid export membrane protein